jgi:hypothetical protein
LEKSGFEAQFQIGDAGIEQLRGEGETAVVEIEDGCGCRREVEDIERALWLTRR